MPSVAAYHPENIFRNFMKGSPMSDELEQHRSTKPKAFERNDHRIRYSHGATKTQEIAETLEEWLKATTY
jgi:hypothetical protein